MAPLPQESIAFPVSETLDFLSSQGPRSIPIHTDNVYICIMSIDISLFSFKTYSLCDSHNSVSFGIVLFLSILYFIFFKSM